MTTGTEGNDILQNNASGGSDTVDALGGDDRITVVTPAVVEQFYQTAITVDGGEGSDTLIANFGSYRLSITLGSIFVRQSLNYGFLVNWSNVEVIDLTGTWYVNDTTLGATRDILHLSGNSGTAAAETISTAEGNDEIYISGSEAAIVLAGAGTDIIDFTALGQTLGSVAPSADGGGDNDTIRGSSNSYNSRETLAGGAGDDLIYGNGGNDVLEGGAGADLLDGGAGIDQLTGGTGDDTYVVDDAGDSVIEAADEGEDEVRTALGSRTDFTQLYTLPANVENFTGTAAGGQGVFGNSLDNVFSTGAGSDLIVLHDGGNDSVNAGAGDDFVYYGGAFTNADSNIGGDGYDTLGLVGAYTLTLDADDLVGFEKLALYSSGNPAQPASYAITTNDANVAAGQQLFVVGLSLSAAESLIFNGSAELDGGYVIRSGAGHDTLTSGAKRDDIDGGAGDDVIHGGAGKDSIAGGIGADHLWGDAGADRFVYTAADQSSVAAGIDWIKDFEIGSDKIFLSQFDANGDSSDGVTAFSYIGDAAFTHQAGQLRVQTFANGASLVEADVNGDGQADFVIQITSTTTDPLSSSDFVF